MKWLGGTTSGALANLAAQGLPFVLLLLVTPILLHALGREQYGALVLFNLVPQIAGQLDLGISTAATRGFAQYSARADRLRAMRLFRESAVLLVAWGLVLGGIYYLFHESIANALKLDSVVGDESVIFIVSALTVPLALANGAALIPLRALERYGAAARIQVMGGIAYWIVCAWWALRGSSLTQLVALGSTAVAVTTLALFLSLKRELDRAADARVPSAIDQPDDGAVGPLPTTGFLLRPFMPVGAGAFVAQASSLATYHADKLLVSALLSPPAAGAYAICTSIANKMLLVIAACATYTFPRSARMHAEGDLSAIAATFVIASRLSMVLATAMAVPLIALAPAFLTVWLGREFAGEHATTLALLSLGYAIAASSVVSSNVAIGIGEVRMPAFFAMVGGVVTLVAVALLAPRYGAAGAACAAVIGMTQALAFNGLLAKRLGPASREASWNLVWQLVLVGVPVAVAFSFANPYVQGWITLGTTGAVCAALFLALWLLTFGRDHERVLVDRFILKARNVPHGH